MKIDHFITASGWTKEKVAFVLNLPIDVVETWDEIPDMWLREFQRFLFDLDYMK